MERDGPINTVDLRSSVEARRIRFLSILLGLGALDLERADEFFPPIDENRLERALAAVRTGPSGQEPPSR